jgi:hypothetical protein
MGARQDLVEAPLPPGDELATLGERRNWLWAVIAESRQAKIGLAVLAFFILAITAWLSGSSLFSCAMRASLGAVVVYIVVVVAARVALAILVDAAVRNPMQSSRKDLP